MLVLPFTFKFHVQLAIDKLERIDHRNYGGNERKKKYFVDEKIIFEVLFPNFFAQYI